MIEWLVFRTRTLAGNEIEISVEGQGSVYRLFGRATGWSNEKQYARKNIYDTTEHVVKSHFLRLIFAELSVWRTARHVYISTELYIALFSNTSTTEINKSEATFYYLDVIASAAPPPRHYYFTCEKLIFRWLQLIVRTQQM